MLSRARTTAGYPRFIPGSKAINEMKKALTSEVKVLPARARAPALELSPKTESDRSETATNSSPTRAPAAEAPAEK